jgi:hypothetical protein
MHQKHDRSSAPLDDLIAQREAQRVIGQHVLGLLNALPRYKRRLRQGRLTQHAFAMTLVMLLKNTLYQAANGADAITALEASIGHIFPPHSPFHDFEDDIPF